MRLLSEESLRERLVPYFQDAGLIDATPTTTQLGLLAAATPLVQERMTLLTEAIDMLRFLFVSDDDFAVDEADAAKNLDAAGLDVVRAARDALDAIPSHDAEWTTATIEGALRAALIDGLGLKPRLAFGPVRVAATGSRISPPLFESLELLGHRKTIARLDAALG